MPLYRITDPETGVRLDVEGPTAPTQDDARELFQRAKSLPTWGDRLQEVEKRREKFRAFRHEFSPEELRKFRRKQEADVADDNNLNDGYNRTARLIGSGIVGAAKNFVDAVRATGHPGQKPLQKLSETMGEVAEGLRYSSNPHEAETVSDIWREYHNSGIGGALPALGEVTGKIFIQNAPNLAGAAGISRLLTKTGMSLPRAIRATTGVNSGLQGAGSFYSEAVDDLGMDEAKARRRALMIAPVAAGLEQFGDAQILRLLFGPSKSTGGVGASLRRILGSGGKESLSEASQEAAALTGLYWDQLVDAPANR